jgi:hypothetical protein
MDQAVDIFPDFLGYLGLDATAKIPFLLLRRFFWLLAAIVIQVSARYPGVPAVDSLDH